MAIIFQTDKRSGITYAYEATYTWDRDKKQSRSVRKLIGRVDDSGNVVPTDGRCRKDKPTAEEAAKRGPVPASVTRHPAHCRRVLGV